MYEHRLVDQIQDLLNLFQDQSELQELLTEVYNPSEAIETAQDYLPAKDEDLLKLLEENELDPEWEMQTPTIKKELEQLRKTDWGPQDSPSEEYSNLAADILNRLLGIFDSAIEKRFPRPTDPWQMP